MKTFYGYGINGVSLVRVHSIRPGPDQNKILAQLAQKPNNRKKSPHVRRYGATQELGFKVPLHYKIPLLIILSSHISSSSYCLR
jgi:hypothetical protein